MKTKNCLFLILTLVFVLFMTGNILAEEPPRFEERVAEGELPPLENRIPVNPLEVGVIEEIGQYGGQLNTAVVGEPRTPWTLLTGEGLLKWQVGEDGETFISPNVAEDWEMSDDGKEFTFYLREGIKWSDGEPFSADDIIFWWDDIAMNEEIYPGGWPVRRGFYQGGYMEAEKIDDYTVKFIFPEPQPLFPNYMAHERGWHPVRYPKHYLQQFHPDYTDPELVEQRIEEMDEDYIGWTEYMEDVQSWFGASDDPELPSLNAYNVVEKGTTAWIFEANPFYWKVDSEGNQLPYIDEVRAEGVTDATVLEGKILTGEIDYYGDFQTSFRDVRTYRDYEEEGDYRLLLYDNTVQSKSFDVRFNYDDEFWREINQDPKFRHAISLAINRQEINETFFFGLAKTNQATVHQSSVLYEEEFAQAYADYNPEKANELLDEIGLDEKDSRGFRLRPDGERMRILVQLDSDEHIAIFELIEEYWQDIGIEVEIRMASSELLEEREQANELQIGNLADIDRMVDAMFFVDPMWFALNEEIYTDYQEREIWELQPPELVEQLERRRNMQTALDEEERIEIGREIVKSQAENLWQISVIGNIPKEVFAKNNLRNVPQEEDPESIWGFDFFWAYLYNPEQFFFKE